MSVFKTGGARQGVVISGAYGMENAGDDAVLSSILRQLRRIDGTMPITVLARKPKKTGRRFSVAAVHPFDLLRIPLLLRRTRLFISGGGSLLQDVTSRRSLLYYLALIRLAKKCGCAVQLYGCGIGPLEREDSRTRTAAVLNRCADAASLRDGESLRLLQDMGVTEPKLLLAADPALASDAVSEERERAIGFILRDWPDFWARVPDVAAAARHAYETYRLTPVFFCFAPEDRTAARSVCAELADIPHGIRTQTSRIGRMSLVVSMRLHGLVFALRDATPAAGISYDPKVAAFCGEAGLPCLSLSDAAADRLCALIDEAARLDAETLSAAAQTLRQREKANARTAAELLAEGC